MFDKEKYKNIAIEILSPIKPLNRNPRAKEKKISCVYKSFASFKLPEYYFIYFLFSDLLNYNNLGRFEKIAWAFPFDYNGKTFCIEYRKFGVGLYIQDKESDETEAEEIVKKISSAIKNIRPFYDHIAETAVQKSEFSVVNRNTELYERFNFLIKLYKKEYGKYLKNKGKVERKSKKTEHGEMISFKSLDFQYYQKANWIAISCIEAFFSWTEHLFIHLAIVAENLSDGEKVSKLTEAEWKMKFQAAIKDRSAEASKFYSELLIVRQQLRNFVAHGAFGKNGNAFKFHSATGTVPVLMNHNKQKNSFSLHGYLTFKEEDVIKLIEDFITFLWSGTLLPAMFYCQECNLPAILTYAVDGTYKAATTDLKSMKHFSTHLIMQFDDAANMDW